MITLTKLDRTSRTTFAVNPDLIERVYEAPDTMVVMVDGATHVVNETMREVIELITSYRVQVLAAAAVIANANGGVR